MATFVEKIRSAFASVAAELNKKLNVDTAAATYAKEAELGAEESEAQIRDYVEKAMKIFDEHENRDGYYAFVCEKCASVFGYFGYFICEKELEKRAREIYERT